jgi:hypothetical protein
MSLERIPDALLAQAKDSRYREQCQRLVSQFPCFSRRQSTAADADATLIASVLYALLVILPKGKTLGDIVVEMDYTTASKYKLALASLVSAVWTFGLERLAHDNADSHEELTGDVRRAMFQRQRRVMMERARDPSAALQPQQRTTLPRDSIGCNSAWPTNRMKQLLRSFAKLLVPGTNQGPHFVFNNRLSAARSVGAWLVRLNLAMYCLNGRYPTCMHRLWRIQYADTTKSQRLSNRPTSHRIVGIFILAEAFGRLVPAVGEFVLGWWIKRRPANAPFKITSSSREAPLANAVSCGICRQPRIHPACPIQCGHVFCWCVFD